ncbi:uncharacterized protein LOC143217605 [Lasioglossum baleicum]|uniref:uncharacterized protein LOC143217605 n=1 Tax=Lasioglossum baleicum TaxID=434251 RepID=UPI003FCD9678
MDSLLPSSKAPAFSKRSAAFSRSSSMRSPLRTPIYLQVGVTRLLHLSVTTREGRAWFSSLQPFTQMRARRKGKWAQGEIGTLRGMKTRTPLTSDKRPSVIYSLYSNCRTELGKFFLVVAARPPPLYRNCKVIHIFLNGTRYFFTLIDAAGHSL